MDIVFSNRTDTIETQGSDLGDGFEHVSLDIFVRNQGTVKATRVGTHIFIDENLETSIYQETADSFVPPFIELIGQPPSYELASGGSQVINPATPIDMGVLQFRLKPGTYSIATEVDDHEEEHPTVGTLHFTVLPLTP